MNVSRIVLLVLCMALPAVTWRLGGVSLWIGQAVGGLAAAGLALWFLYDDGLLRGAFQYKPGDPSIALLAALGFFGLVVLLVNHWLAPEPYLHVCGPRGVWMPRLGVAGLARVAEWFRGQACEAWFRSAGLRGPLRGPALLFLAATEEIAWRGGVQQLLSERLGSVRGWGATALLFGLAHLATGNVSIALLALVGGALWGGIFLWRGRLLPAIASHGVFSFALFHQNAPFVIRYETFH